MRSIDTKAVIHALRCMRDAPFMKRTQFSCPYAKSMLGCIGEGGCYCKDIYDDAIELIEYYCDKKDKGAKSNGLSV